MINTGHSIYRYCDEMTGVPIFPFLILFCVFYLLCFFFAVFHPFLLSIGLIRFFFVKDSFSTELKVEHSIYIIVASFCHILIVILSKGPH